jgi:hypothetical protein
MPGIANKYFRIHRRAPSVGGMTCAPYALTGPYDDVILPEPAHSARQRARYPR